jgi:hypothetical protein
MGLTREHAARISKDPSKSTCLELALALLATGLTEEKENRE